MSSNKTQNKIIKSFFVVGIDETKIQIYSNANINDEIYLRFIQNIDIINSNINIKNDRYDAKNEKWLRIINNPNSWLRFQYTENYTNPITDIRIQECDYYTQEYLLLPRYLYENGYRPVKITKYQNQTNNIKDIPKIIPEERTLTKLDKDYVLVPVENDAKFSLSLPTKKSAALLLVCRKVIFLPLKEVIIQKKPEQKNYQFGILRHKSPYIYKYMPAILDTYPNNEEPNQSVGLFCFPEGIQIKDKFEQIKCFNFVLTDELGERTYGSTLIFMEEISISLREAFIPTYDDPNKTFYCQKAICILSKYPFYYNCLLFLKEIYNICDYKYTGKIPVERAICTFVDSLFIQTYDKILRFNINDKNLDFYRIANYGKLWDTNDKYLETLFRVLNYEQIITAWEGLLLEKKLFLICSSKAVLSQVAHALINLLFPFKWIHVYVPILPEKLKLFIESPVPLIIGISFHIEINELPSDSLILNINKNCFENYKEKLPPLPHKLNKILMNKLIKLKEEYNLDNPQYVEKWFNYQEDAVLYLGPEILLFPKIDISEIRDAFYNVFISMFKNYEKYISWNKKSENIMETENIFLKENFLKDNNSNEENSFLYLFSETALFNQFIDCFGTEENKVKSSFAFFLESIKKGKGKNKYFLSNIIPQNVVFAPKIEISDLNNRTFNYPEFPKLDSSLFIKHEIPKIPYKSKFLYLRDEWCYSTEKFKRKDWPRYFLFLIYDIWFTFFSFVLNIYEDNQAIIMMDYALSLIEYLSDNLKISPTRNLFSKIIKSCGRNVLNPFIKQMLIMVKNINKGQSKYNALFHNDYLNGLYFLTENVGQSYLGASLNNSLLLMNTLRASVITEMKKTDNNIEYELKKIIFMTYNLCENCLKSEKITNIPFDEILSGFIMKNNDDNTSICPICLNKFEPKIFYLENDQENLNLKEINFFSPIQLSKKIDEIIKNNGELYFYKEIDWNDIYWNIIFYFQLFDLPTCVLYVQNNMEKFEKLKNILKENKKRKFNKEKKVQKKNIFFFGKLNKTSNDVTSDLNDNSRYDNNNNSNLTDISINSVKSGVSFISNTEMDIWKNYQLNKKNKKKEIKDINTNNEDKNEINLRVKETKSFLGDIISNFNIISQEKLKKFLEKYDQLEALRQHDYVNMYLKKENEKYEKNQNKTKIKQIQKSPKKEIPLQQEIKKTQILLPQNQQQLKQTQIIPQNQEQLKKEEILLPKEQNINDSQIKKNDIFSIDTKLNFKLTERTKKENNNKINEGNTQNENNLNKIPLDSVKKKDNEKIQKNIYNINNKNINNNLNNINMNNKNNNNINNNINNKINNNNINNNVNNNINNNINNNVNNNMNNNMNNINSNNKINNINNNKNNNNMNRIVGINKIQKNQILNNNKKIIYSSKSKNRLNNNRIRINNMTPNRTFNKVNNDNILNKTEINQDIIFNYDNKTINYQSKKNISNRYAHPLDSNNIVKFQVPIDNYNKINNFSITQKKNSQQKINQKEKFPKSKTQRKKGYQIYQVPAYKSIFDNNNSNL